MKAAPIPKNDLVRLRELYLYEILDTPEEAYFDEITKLAKSISGCKIALISLVDESRQWFKSKQGLDACETGRDISFCGHAINQELDFFEIEDSREDSRFYDNPLVTGDPKVIYYGGIKLVSPNGHAIGTLCVINDIPGKLSDNQINILKSLGKQLIEHLNLRRSYISLNTVAEHAGEIQKLTKTGGWVLNLDSNDLYWSDEVYRIHALPIGTDVSKVDAISFYVDDAQELITKYVEACATLGEQYDDIFRFKDAHGNLKWVRAIGKPVYQDGKIKKLMGTFQDVSELIEKEKELQRSREYFKLAISGSNLGIWDWHFERNTVNYDKNWCEMLGLDFDQTPKDFSVWESHVHPDDKEIALKKINEYINGNTKSYEITFRMKHTDGHWVYILSKGRFSEYDEKGKPIRLTGTHLDITDSVEKSQIIDETNKRLEIALEASTNAVWEWDLLSKKHIWDKQMYIMFDCDQSDDPERCWHERVHPADKDIIGKEIQNAIESGDKYEGLFRLFDRENKIKHIKTVAVILKDELGRPIKLLGVNQDISDDFKRTKELENAKNKAIIADNAKSEFLANMSHEIRTPLNGIMATASLLSETKLTQEQAEMVRIINSSGNGLTHILNDILDFSKIESGKLEINPISFNTHKFFDDISVMANHLLSNKDVHFELNKEVNIPNVIISDDLRIRQILMNLVSNSVKFTSHGIITLNIFVKDQNIHFKISDTGIGIDSQKIPKLFKPFTQMDSSTTRNFGGTGLGLSICKKLAQLMNGDIQYIDEAGEGAVFEFYVPFTIPKNDKVEEIEKNVSHTVIAGEKVLLVEDNLTNQKVASLILKKVGVDFDIANNGQEAVDLIQNNQYKCVFMDVQMPVMDGIEATKKIREFNTDILIIAMTANAFMEDKNRCLEAGMNDYLSKPISLGKVRDSLNKITS